MTDPVAWRAAAVIRRDNVVAAIDSRVADLNTLVTAMNAGGAAWDNLSPANRTLSIKSIAQDVIGLANLVRQMEIDLLDSP